MLDKSKLGNRYSCFACGTKFYDLNKSPATCPECGASQEDAPTRDKMRDAMGRGPAPSAAKEPSKAAPETETLETSDEDGGLEIDGMEDMEGMHIVDEDAEDNAPADDGEEDA